MGVIPPLVWRYAMSELSGLFIFNDDLDNILENLSGDEALELLGMLREYNKTGTANTDNTIVRIMFNTIRKNSIDCKKEKQAEISQKRSEAGKLGGRPRNNQEKPEEAKKANAINEKQKKQMLFSKAKKAVHEHEHKHIHEHIHEHEQYISPPTPSERGDSEPIDGEPIDLNDTSGVVIDMQTINQSSNKQQLGALFDKFWTEYPRKEDKTKAKKAFIKLHPDNALVSEMLNALSWQKTTEQWRDRRYIPLPTTYLNGRRWEDEQPAQPARQGQPGYADELVAQGISPF